MYWKIWLGFSKLWARWISHQMESNESIWRQESAIWYRRRYLRAARDKTLREDFPRKLMTRRGVHPWATKPLRYRIGPNFSVRAKRHIVCSKQNGCSLITWIPPYAKDPACLRKNDDRSACLRSSSNLILIRNRVRKTPILQYRI